VNLAFLEVGEVCRLEELLSDPCRFGNRSIDRELVKDDVVGTNSVLTVRKIKEV
jgi:hypothetical protein